MAGKTVNQMLIELYKEEREQERCVIVHGLRAKADKIIKTYHDQERNIEPEISELNNRIWALRTKQNNIKDARDADLKKVRLFNFEQNICGDALHADLIKFDKTTKHYIREILMDE